MTVYLKQGEPIEDVYLIENQDTHLEVFHRYGSQTVSFDEIKSIDCIEN